MLLTLREIYLKFNERLKIAISIGSIKVSLTREYSKESSEINSTQLIQCQILSHKLHEGMN